ncbi:phospho-sugar mutase [Vagococcus salmoninarum]|uniref:phospho-sugar mutase n=2 Tax=Vagococcus salmoninarum TaxID=2739 RepID=UPI003F9DABB1
MKWQKNLHSWQKNPYLPTVLQKALLELTEDELADHFYRDLEFGTGGMRGKLGVGTNRLNELTIRRVSIGLAKYICSQGKAAQQKGIVISYDNRHCSAIFAKETADILASFQIKVYLSDKMRPTPELSFAVRKYQAAAGVMITASHNPANYNGFKVYNNEGCQITLEAAEAISNLMPEFVASNYHLFQPVPEEQSRLWISYFGMEIDQTYLEAIKGVNQRPDFLLQSGNELSIIYTPLHGTGQDLTLGALKQAGFTNVELVEAQADGDPDFGTVASPNPESVEAFTMAVNLGKTLDSDLILATDPDADRLGVGVRKSKGEYDLLTGNQLGLILLDYLIRAKMIKGEDLTSYYLVKTIVTSESGNALAHSHNIKVIDTLTGFKFIGEEIERQKANINSKFLFGYEESFGYLVEPFVRDKDAIQGIALVAEVALYYKLQSLTLFDGLEKIYQQIGYYDEQLLTFKFEGQKGSALLVNLMEHFRAQPLTEFNEYNLVSMEDYQEGTSENFLTKKVTSLSLPQSEVLKYRYSDGSWFCIRPSGTEPTCKVYLAVTGETLKETKLKLTELEHILRRKISSLENKETI